MALNLSPVDILGLSAGFCTTVAFLPQAIRVFKTGDTSALSLTMYSVFSLGVALWLAYGIFRKDPAMIIANSITIVLALGILISKIRNDVLGRGTRTKSA